MFDSLTRLLRRHVPAMSDSRLMEEWARGRGDSLKRVRHRKGLVLEFRSQGYAARLEWGPPQRDYIHHRELRVRVELGLPQTLEMAVMNRPLAEHLESKAYAELTHAHRTGIDGSMPEEARWLSMFDPVTLPQAGQFNEDFVILAASPSHARRWIEGDLATRLNRARARWLMAGVPLVVMTLRGRLYLRTEVRTLDSELLDGICKLADVAAGQALRTVSRAPRVSDGSGNGIAAMCHPGAATDQPLSLIDDPGLTVQEALSTFDEEVLSHFSVGTPTDLKI